MDEKVLFAILPYLKTSKQVYIRGIRFRASDDLDGLAEDIRSHLRILFSMFFLRDDLRIKEMTYAYLPLDDDREKKRNVLRRLREARILIGYLYSSPHFPFGDPFLQLEHSSLYLVRPSMVSKYIIWPEHGVENTTGTESQVKAIEEHEVPGYEGLLNWSSYFWVVAGNRLYPAVPDFWLNISQDLYCDLGMMSSQDHNWALRNLIWAGECENEELEKRVFTALEWYNRSSASGISEDVALINLAIAFEGLFQLEQGQALAERFKELVITLLGPVPRLDSWIDQFYTARSKIVHEGSWPHLMFYATSREHYKSILKGKDEGLEYRSLTSYGRHIFRVCLNAVLSGAALSERAGLQSLLFHNQERLEAICTCLRRDDLTPEQKLLSVARDVRDLQEFWLESEELTRLETVVATGKLLVQTYLETKPQLPEEVLRLMEAIVQQKGDASEDAELEKFRNLASRLSEWKGGRPGAGTVAPSDPFHIIWLFVDYAASPGFTLRSRYGFGIGT